MFQLLDDDIEEYCDAHSSPEDKILYELNRETHLKTVNPRMISGCRQGLFLEFISQLAQPERILELGTFTAYTTVCLSRGLKENGLIYTIEKNPELGNIIFSNLDKANVAAKTKVLFGNALDIIPTLEEKWDIIYIDADKVNYLNYYKILLPSLKPNGILFADNVLWNGKISQQLNEKDKDTKAIAEFNKFVQQDERVKNILLPLRDGIMMVKKI
ncbi:MAG TPA: O-methyltransferase [Bacteroidales bacterium]|nr:O-methyltransferase [Bacteroidales bacterium]